MFHHSLAHYFLQKLAYYGHKADWPIVVGLHTVYILVYRRHMAFFLHCWGISASYVFTYGPSTNVEQIKLFIQYFARYWPWYSLRGLHIRITWFSLYGIRIPLFSLYGIYMPLLPYMVIQPIVLGMVLLWAALDSSLSQWPLLWRHNDMTVIVSWNTRGRERDTHQRLDNTDARWLQTVNR